uniref:NADH-ubiquinone oxidoreductase chain 2 n=1 Tax=Bolboceratex sp. BOL01 TaxID=1205609 RepID=A0A0S2MNQ9_9SCAR|nr:NADH deshydrogenase subunit 2 [Bolboceratex sp. BOL01]
MINFYMIPFYFSLMAGTLISISSSTWMGMWLGLEVNLLSFIPLISGTKNMMASEAALKYFITQAMASTLLLFSIILMSFSLMYMISPMIFLMMTLNTSLLIKVGAAPFHFWFTEVMEGLNWMHGLTLLTWQKIAPMVLLIYSSKTTVYLSVIVIISVMVSGILGLNQVSLRKIMTYSSINHIGWMIGAMLYFETIWIYYFLIYTIININIVIMFKMVNTFYVKQLFISMNKNNLVKLFFITNFMSLGGLPPFLGFLPKWLTIQTMVMNNLYSIALVMIVMTLMTLYFYMRLSFSTLVLNLSESSFYSSPPINSTYIWMLNFISIMGFISCTFMFTLM